jgi:acetyltransferase
VTHSKEELVTRDGMRVVLREMRPDDAALHDEFIAALDPQDLRFRFGSRVVEEPQGGHRVIAVDRESDVTIVAMTESAGGKSRIGGELRLHEDADGTRAEFAIAVRTDLQRQGLGRALLEKGIVICRERNLRLLYGLVDRSNSSMIALAQRLGFSVDAAPGGATVVVTHACPT